MKNPSKSTLSRIVVGKKMRQQTQIAVRRRGFLRKSHGDRIDLLASHIGITAQQSADLRLAFLRLQ